MPLGALIPGLLPIIGDVLDRFFPDKEASAKARREIEAQLTSHLASVDIAQIETNREQARHPSIFVAGSRPCIMWICAFGLAWQFIVQPVLVWYMALTGNMTPLPMIPVEGLFTLTASLLGLGSMRSFEKRTDIHRNNMKHS